MASHEASPAVLGIADLSAELLYFVFEHFNLDASPGKGEVECTKCFLNQPHYHDGQAERLRSVQNARLVCRRFKELATPYLVPVLEIKVDLASLERADKLTQCPDIVRGIKIIHINVDYRPIWLSRDLYQFISCRLEDLSKMKIECSHIIRRSEKQTDRWGGRLVIPEREECKQAVARFGQIRAAWNASYNGDFINTKDESLAPLQELLKKAHKLYQQRHAEQLFMIEDGSFVARASSYMVRLGRPISISFGSRFSHSALSEIHTGETWLPGQVPQIRNVDILTDEDSLSQFLTTPYSWNRIDYENLYDAHFKPLRIFPELPIACHRADVRLREVSFQCFPVTHLCRDLSPGGRDRPREGWEELRAAFQYLEKFDFGRTGLTMDRNRHDEPSHVDAMGFREYLGAALASPVLQTVYIKTWSHLCFRMGPVLARSLTLKGRYLKRLHLHDMSMRQNELDAFCQRLPEGLEVLELSRIVIWPGDWTDALDILRSKVARRCTEGQCEVVMKALAWDRPPNAPFHFSLQTPNPNERVLDHAAPPMNPMVWRYVTGDDLDVNPLRILGGIRGMLGPGRHGRR
jgi:hypothetical protein